MLHTKLILISAAISLMSFSIPNIVLAHCTLGHTQHCTQQRLLDLESDVLDHENRIATLEQPGYTIIPFHVTLNPADNTVVDSADFAVSGTLSAFMRCERNTEGFDRVFILFTSTVGFASIGKPDLPANAKLVVRSLVNIQTGNLGYKDGAGVVTAVSTAGDFLGIQALSMGVNILGSRCVAIGTAFTIP